MERVTHAETRQMLKELIVTKEDGVSPKDVSHSPVIEVGGERDTSINSSVAVSMNEFRGEVATVAKNRWKENKTFTGGRKSSIPQDFYFSYSQRDVWSGDWRRLSSCCCTCYKTE